MAARRPGSGPAHQQSGRSQENGASSTAHIRKERTGETQLDREEENQATWHLEAKRRESSRWDGMVNIVLF